MIKGSIKDGYGFEELNADNILKKISLYDIYRYFCAYPFKLGESFCSVLRIDKNPSFLIKISKNGIVYHCDLARQGDTRYNGNAFQFVQQIYNVDYNTALQKVNNCFGLGLGPDSSPVGDYKLIVAKYEQPDIVKHYTRIDVFTRKFTALELDYWAKFTITQEELKKYDVYALDKVYIDGTRRLNRSNDLQFGFYYPELQTWKIYRPNPFDPKEKWRTNTPLTTNYHLHDIKDAENCVLVKARKDFILFKRYIDACCTTENESLYAVTEENMNYLKANAKTIYVNFDADNVGKAASWEYTNVHKTKHINVPDIYLNEGIKDFASLVEHKGIKPFEDYLKQKQLIK
jgi:hypothetical protein